MRRLDDLAAFQLAVQFKLQVYRLIREHPAARQSLRYCNQLQDAASDIEADVAEGWRRYHAREMALFIRYALASLEEAKTRIRDGVHRGYFEEHECKEALNLGNRCGAAMMALLKSLQKMPPRARRGRSNQDPGGPSKPPNGR